MARETTPLFFDTAYINALVNTRDQWHEAAVQWDQNRAGKDWGITDCSSFVVMSERGLSEALTTDEHFRQAGFRALLREEPFR